jgi:GT2 family glycosyltransferase
VINKVAIIILNWNGWKDTIECLESVFRLNYPNYQVIVVDNCSHDGSMKYIKEWAEGEREILSPEPTHPLYHLSHPPVQKPIPYIEYRRKIGEAGGLKDEERLLYEKLPKGFSHPLILIQTDDNLGFSGGNNVGIRYALAKGAFDYIWILNNDVVVENDSLKNLIKIDYTKTCIIGSIICSYKRPELIQTVGGAKFNKYLLRSKYVFSNYSLNEIKQLSLDYLNRVDYISGAALLVPVKYIFDVGLLDERFFLYYEELDWQIRGAELGYGFKIAFDSIVYHKEGATIGSSKILSEKSAKSEYFSNKSAIVFALKHYGSYGKIFITLRFFAKLLSYIVSGKIYLIKILISSYMDFLLFPKKNVN